MALKVSCYVSIVNSFFLKIILILGTNKSDQKHIILLPHCAAAVCCRQKNCYCSKIHGIEKGRIYQHFFCSFSDLHNAITHHCVHYVFSNTICVSLYCCLLLGCGIYVYMQGKKQIHGTYIWASMDMQLLQSISYCCLYLPPQNF